MDRTKWFFSKVYMENQSGSLVLILHTNFGEKTIRPCPIVFEKFKNNMTLGTPKFMLPLKFFMCGNFISWCYLPNDGSHHGSGHHFHQFWDPASRKTLFFKETLEAYAWKHILLSLFIPVLVKLGYFCSVLFCSVILFF